MMIFVPLEKNPVRDTHFKWDNQVGQLVGQLVGQPLKHPKMSHLPHPLMN